MPRVSVIIPAYNRADVLPRAIDSALAQSFEDLEVVVVDDGSTDGTGSVIESYDDPRVRCVVHETNLGANVARNTGIERARGEYVAFLDSDDEWRPTKLRRQLELLERRSDEWVAAYCGFTVETPGASGWVQSQAARVLARADDEPQTEGGEELIGEIFSDAVQPGAGSTILVRTDVARSVGGFDETLDRFQDPEFVVRILQAGKLARVDVPLVVRHETGTPSADVVRDASEQYLAKYEDTVDRLEADGYEIQGSHDLVLAKQYYAEGRLLRGTEYLRTAAVRRRHCPGLFWAAANGLRRRSLPVFAAVAVGTLLLALVIVGRIAAGS